MVPSAQITTEEYDKLRGLITEIFEKNVKGKKPDTSASHQKHSGKEGHWLETQMGVAHNRNNAPDLYGFEMKNITGSKTTFGDWSASYYIFKDPASGMNRDDFLKIFGCPNAKKNNRYSWSGKPCPTIRGYNTCGQILIVDTINNILALYDWEKDQRPDKESFVPEACRKSGLLLARWDAEMMKKRVENKFNLRGWFRCIKDEAGFYSAIIFGATINFERWITDVKNGSVFFDSGMYSGNNRPYSQWRANNTYWENLVI